MYLTFDSEGIIQEGTTKSYRRNIGNAPIAILLKDLNLGCSLLKNRSEKSDIFKRWVHQVFGCKLYDLIDLAPKLFEGNHKKYIELESSLALYSGRGKINIHKLILIASDKTKELELKDS